MPGKEGEIRECRGEEPAITLKLVTIGDSGVGKTSLVRTLTDPQFRAGDDVSATTGSGLVTFDTTVNGQDVRVHLYDTVCSILDLISLPKKAGQEKFSVITASYYHNCHGALVVYDVADEDTSDSVTNWIGEIARFSNIKGTIPVMVCGNKTDLGSKVSLDDVRERVGGRDAIGFAETTIYKKETVSAMFLDLIRLALPFYIQVAGPIPAKKPAKQKKGCTIL